MRMMTYLDAKAERDGKGEDDEDDAEDPEDAGAAAATARLVFTRAVEVVMTLDALRPHARCKQKKDHLQAR